MKKSKGIFAYWNKPNHAAYLFILPAAILLLVFNVIPLLASFYISTQKMGVYLSDAEFVGFDNYKKIVGDRRFWQSVGITLKYTAAEIPLQMIIGVVLSALLAKNTRKNKIFRSIYFLPVIASAVTVGVTWQLVLHSNIGIFTYWLKLLGFSDINLLNNTNSAIFVVVCVDQLLFHNHQVFCLKCQDDLSKIYLQFYYEICVFQTKNTI